MVVGVFVAGCGTPDFENKEYSDEYLLKNPKELKELILLCNDKTNGELEDKKILNHNCSIALELLLDERLPSELRNDKELNALK